MSELVERVARAMCDNGVNWDNGPNKDLWRKRARAAIAEMREPTEAMLSAGDSATPLAEANNLGQRMQGREVALEAWTAMIDEALK